MATERVITRAGRKYPFVGGLEMHITDGGNAYLRHMAATWPAEFARALKSAGFHLRKELQDAIYKGGPSGGRWKPLSRPHAMRIIDDYKGRPREPRTHPFGRLVRAIGYRYDDATKSVRVGWLSNQSARFGRMLQESENYTVTPKMRRFFWALGIPVAKGTTTFSRPSRELFVPVMRANEQRILQYVESHVHAQLRKSTERFAWAA